MMPPDRMPSISLGIIVPAGATYDSHHHWHSSDGVPNASVRFDAGGYSSAHIQGAAGGPAVGRRGLHPRPSAATVQCRLLGKLDLAVAPGRGLAAEAALVRAGPGASLPPWAKAGLPGRTG
jgi:hypothetical protein